MARDAVHSQAEFKMVPVLARVVCSIPPALAIVAQKVGRTTRFSEFAATSPSDTTKSEFQGWKSREN
jgi:hypothetical protein